MSDLPLDRRIDNILDVIYDAADVPHIHRKHIGYLFEEAVDDLIDSAVEDRLENLPDKSEEIKDLDDRVKKLKDTLDSMARLLTDREK